VAHPVAERVYELRSERRHGASWMARRAVETLVEVAKEAEADTTEALYEELLEGGRGLALARPEVGAITGALGRVLAAGRRNLHLDASEFRRLVEEEACALIAARDRAAASIAIQLRRRLTDGVVLTHSASATVREALLYAAPREVVCTVSAPNEEGRAFADELREAELSVELVGDEEAPAALERCSLLLLGADTVFRDGTFANKIGTRRLAEAASKSRIATVVAAEVIKLAPVDGAEAPELEGEAADLFELTPATYVEEVVTEEGTFRPDEIASLVQRVPFLDEGYALIRR